MSYYQRNSTRNRYDRMRNRRKRDTYQNALVRPCEDRVIFGKNDFPPLNPNHITDFDDKNVISWKDVIMHKKEEIRFLSTSKKILYDLPLKDNSPPAKVCKIFIQNTHKSNLLVEKEEYDEIYDTTYLGCDDYEVQSYGDQYSQSDTDQNVYESDTESVVSG